EPVRSRSARPQTRARATSASVAYRATPPDQIQHRRAKDSISLALAVRDRECRLGGRRSRLRGEAVLDDRELLLRQLAGVACGHARRVAPALHRIALGGERAARRIAGALRLRRGPRGCGFELLVRSVAVLRRIVEVDLVDRRRGAPERSAVA